MTVEFEIPRIQPKERPRVAYASRTIYTPRNTTNYESEVRFLYNITCGHVFEGAVKVDMIFMMHRPKTVKREHPSVIPDIDNLVKIHDGRTQSAHRRIRQNHKGCMGG